MFDDLFDTALGRSPEQAVDLVRAVQAVLDREPDVDDAPIVVAFADVWRRSREGMSEQWTARAVRHWHDYLEGHVQETRNRVADGDPGHAEQAAVRAETGGVRPILDLAERLGGYEPVGRRRGRPVGARDAAAVGRGRRAGERRRLAREGAGHRRPQPRAAPAAGRGRRRRRRRGRRAGDGAHPRRPVRGSRGRRRPVRARASARTRPACRTSSATCATRWHR
nr:terpene synthase family protein [Angustibacter aerolatus]